MNKKLTVHHRILSIAYYKNNSEDSAWLLIRIPLSLQQTNR
mgnify:CR=1 FL=1